MYKFLWQVFPNHPPPGYNKSGDVEGFLFKFWARGAPRGKRGEKKWAGFFPGLIFNL